MRSVCAELWRGCKRSPSKFLRIMLPRLPVHRGRSVRPLATDMVERKMNNREETSEELTVEPVPQLPVLLICERRHG